MFAIAPLKQVLAAVVGHIDRCYLNGLWNNLMALCTAAAVVLMLIWLPQTLGKSASRPSGHVEFIGYTPLVHSPLTAFINNITTGRVLQQGSAKFEKAGTPFAVRVLRRYIVCVTSLEQIEELMKASPHHLSFPAAVHDRIFPRYILAGMSLAETASAGHDGIHVLQKPSKVEASPSELPFEIDRRADHFSAPSHIRGHKCALNIVSDLVNTVIVGNDLALDPEYKTLILNWVVDATIILEVLNYTPSFLVPAVAFIMLTWRGSLAAVIRKLTPHVEDQLQGYTKTQATQSDGDHGMCWTIECINDKRSLPVIRELLVFTFAGMHQPVIFLMSTLCALAEHPEYLPALRQEALKSKDMDYDFNEESMPLLDSFLKEVARLNPGSVVATMRKAVTDFTFRDGTHIPRGNWILLNQKDHMLREQFFEQAGDFNGFRFVSDGKSTSRLVKAADASFTFWGSPRLACPARFYMTHMLKIIITQLIIDHDISIGGFGKVKKWEYGAFECVDPSTKICLRKRKAAL